MQTVLVIEDNEAVMAMYKRALEHAGYKVISSDNGYDGAGMAANEQPDIIVTGIMMPRINGFDMIKMLKSVDQTEDIPIIIASNLYTDNDRKRGLELGAVLYLSKQDMKPSDLVESVRQVLTGKVKAPLKGEIYKEHQTSKTLAQQNNFELFKYGFIGLAILAVVATQSIDSFDFYMFVRWAMFTGFIASIWLLKEDDERSWMIVLSLIGAFIFNPFSIVTNSKDWWVIVDLITAFYFGYLAYLANEEKT